VGGGGGMGDDSTIELCCILMSSKGHPLPSTASRSKFFMEEHVPPLPRPQDNPVRKLHSNLEFQRHLTLIIILIYQHFAIVIYVFLRFCHYTQI